MFNADDLVKLIKKSALEAVNASKPSNVVFGKVISESPLKIKVDQKLVLTSAQLVLARNVTDYEVSTTVNFTTGTALEHSHTVKETKPVKIHNALKNGEEVILIQLAGGQKYVVIDRIGKG